MAKFADQIYEFQSELMKMTHTIRRFDEVLCMKCNRAEFKDFQNYCSQDFYTKREFAQQYETFNSQLEANVKKFGNLEEVVRYQAKQLQAELYSTVKREILRTDNKTKSGEVEGASESIMEAIKGKATRVEVDTVTNQKANKIDVEICLKWVDLLHKMVGQIMLLLTMKFKVDIDQVGGETQNT